MNSVRMCLDVLHIYTMLCNVLWTEVFAYHSLILKQVFMHILYVFVR